MSLSHQQYADLANDAYRDYPPGTPPEGQRRIATVNGADYEIVEHHTNPLNGYQGTVYRAIGSGEFIVAHRGTEQLARDGALTDGGMVGARFNPQAADAIALTRRTLQRAELEGRRTGHTPEVTTTGHSLGGTLAQVSAHHFGLRGETFNAYGAVSLGLRTPEGGDRVVNHVMAADIVSAASRHYGQVRTYATRDQVEALARSGYDNQRNLLDPRSLKLAVGRTLDAHSMHHFTAHDGDGRPDRSILADPLAREMARRFEPMIDAYRGDALLARGLLTVGLRGPVGNAVDAVDGLRGPVPAGARHRQEQQAAAARVLHEPPRAPPPASPLFAPGGPLDLPDYLPEPATRGHAPLRAPPPEPVGRPDRCRADDRLSGDDHALVERIEAVAREHGLDADAARNAALALTARIREDGLLPRIDRLLPVEGRGADGGVRLFAAHLPHGDRAPRFHTYVDLGDAARVPADDSLARIEQARQAELQPQLARQQEQQQDVARMAMR